MAITWYEPAMTGANTPVPYVATASSTHSHSSYRPWVAFKKDVINSSTGDCWVTVTNVTTGWLQLDFGAPTPMSNYQMRIRGYTGPNGGQYTGMPRNWTMQGSNDGVNFTIIETRTNETWSVQTGPWRQFNTGKIVSYRYYRIDITANNGEPSGILLGKLQFGLDPAFASKSIFKNTITGKFYTIDGNNVVELIDDTQSTVEQFGIAAGTTITVANVTDFKTLVGPNFKIIAYGTDPITPPIISIKENFTGRKFAYSYPIGMAGVDQIANVALVASGDVRHVISLDGDITWWKFDGAAWVQVVDMSQGMSTAEFNAITLEQYKLIYTGQSVITFGHSLDVASAITSLTLKVNLKGVTRLAPVTSFTQSFDQATRTIAFNISKSGQYSINYVDSL